MNTLKKKLDNNKGKWVSKLLSILWSHRTTARMSTGETPFSLIYRAEAMILVEISIKSARVFWADEGKNNAELSQTFDTIDEIRDKAAIRIASYQQQVARYYNKNLRLRSFKVNDWVLRKVFQNTKEAGTGKLTST